MMINYVPHDSVHLWDWQYWHPGMRLGINSVSNVMLNALFALH